MWADTGTVSSWKSQATTRTGHTHQVRICRPRAASSRNRPRTCGLVAACILLMRSGNRNSPIAAPRDMSAPTTINTAETASITVSGFTDALPPFGHEAGHGDRADEADEGNRNEQHQ